MKNLRISFVGDIYMDNAAIKALKQDNILSKYFKDSDLLVANLEAPITKNRKIRENKRYNFSISPEALEFFEKNTVLTIANNHILDFGRDGLSDTVSHMTDKEISFSGAGMDFLTASKPVIYKTYNATIGVLCAADRRFQSNKTDEAVIFTADFKKIFSAFQNIKESVDIAIATIHSGTEYINIPSPDQIQLAKKLIDIGIKIVHFHHAHCLSGTEKYKSGIILFGTGNFIFPISFPKSYNKFYDTAIFHIELDTAFEITDVKIKPARIDQNGVPRMVENDQEKRILDKIEKISNCIRKDNVCLAFLRFKELIHPVYLKILSVHLVDIAKRKGFAGMLKVMFQSLKIQFFVK